MKTENELLQMLFVRLAELQDGRIKSEKPIVAEHLQIELALLYEILEDKINDEYSEYCEAIEAEIR